MKKRKKRSTSDSSPICWCGFDKPYRDCHLNREKQTPLEPYEITAEFRKEYSKRYCLHPQKSPTACSPQIIKAHSVSRSSSLIAIAENGHVMEFNSSFQLLLKNDGRLTAQRIGVKLASTFTGFCHTHDFSTFSIIDQPITNLSEEQIFLLAYRAVCRELFVKKAAMELTKLARQLDKGKDEAAQRLIHDFNKYREMGLQTGLQYLTQQKAEYDKALLQKRYDTISYYVVGLDHTPEIICTVGFTPEVDFHGNRLQRLDHPTRDVDILTCSIIKITGGSAIVFAWLSEKNGACSGLISSLDQIKTHLLPSAIARLVFEHGENVFFSPSWWNGLDHKTKAKIEMRANSFTGKPDDCLKDDGCRSVLWSIIGRQKKLAQTRIM